MDQPNTITYVFFIIFTGAALLSTIALFTRQSLLVAYIVLGAIVGPWGLKLVTNSATIEQAGDVGIIFLLFLVGLHLQPQNLFHSLRKMSWITFASSFIFFITGFIVCYAFGYSFNDSLMIGLVSMFSSTIIGIKLLPTTILHHQHTGELVISILLLQDIIAIAAMLGLRLASTHGTVGHIELMIVAFPLLVTIAYLFQRYVIAYLLSRFDKIHEYILIFSIGWCLLLAELARYLSLSEEIGAFIAGVSFATHRISFYIADNLKPLRDFFLVLFFFSIGASFNFGIFQQIIAPACLLVAFIIMIKPMVFSWLLVQSGEVKSVSWEIGVRLGQLSEFSLLIIYIAKTRHLMTDLTSYMAQTAVILSFIVSCYWTVMRYPTPLAATDHLRRD